MKKLFTVIAATMLVACSNDDSTKQVQNQNPAFETWQGKMSGDTTATMLFHIDMDGTITGAYFLPAVSDFEFHGNVTDGNVWMLPTDSEGIGGVRFVGYRDRDSIFGNWQDGARNWNGEFKAWKQ